MAVSASFAAAFTTLSRAIKTIDQLNTDSAALLALIDTCVEGADGDFIDEQSTALQARQSTIAALLDPAEILATLEPFINDVWLFIDGTAETLEERIIEIRDYMVAESKSVETRTMAISTLTAGGSNVGGGAMYVLEKDRHNSALQAAIPEAVSFKCVKDRGSGALRNNEQFEYQGTTAHKDSSKIDGSGLKAPIKAAYDSENVLSNPRFTSFNGTTPTAGSDTTAPTTTAFSSWVLDTAASFKATVDNVSRKSSSQSGATTDNAKALVFSANGNVYQRLLLNGKSFNEEVPYLAAAYCYKPTGADGTATLAWGSKSQGFTVSSSISNNSFGWLVADQDQDLYYDRWKQDDPQLKLTLGSASTFGLKVIELAFIPGQLINGFWWWILGDDTPFQRDDVFTTTISQSADGVNQRILFEHTKISNNAGFALSFPSSGTPTEADA